MAVTLQQLRYVLKIVEMGSITSAASALFIAQPSLSKAVAELERELGIRIFERSSRGVELTDDGERFIASVRNVIEQADLLEARYKGSAGPRSAFSISAQHDPLVTSAFSQVVRTHASERFEFTLREESVPVIIESVRSQRSELGVLFRSAHNRAALEDAVRGAGLRFAPISSVHPVVLVGKGSPLAAQREARLEDLENHLCVEYMVESGAGAFDNPVDDLLPLPAASKRVVASDWETVHDLVVSLDAYTIALGTWGGETPRTGFSCVALAGFGMVELGILSRPGYPLSPAGHDFSVTLAHISHLDRYL